VRDLPDGRARARAESLRRGVLQGIKALIGIGD